MHWSQTKRRRWKMVDYHYFVYTLFFVYLNSRTSNQAVMRDSISFQILFCLQYFSFKRNNKHKHLSPLTVPAATASTNLSLCRGNRDARWRGENPADSSLPPNCWGVLAKPKMSSPASARRVPGRSKSARRSPGLQSWRSSRSEDTPPTSVRGRGRGRGKTRGKKTKTGRGRIGRTASTARWTRRRGSTSPWSASRRRSRWGARRPWWAGLGVFSSRRTTSTPSAISPAQTWSRTSQHQRRPRLSLRSAVWPPLPLLTTTTTWRPTRCCSTSQRWSLTRPDSIQLEARGKERF